MRFNKTVVVTGEPQLRLRVGTLTRAATYRDSAGEVVRFVYPVVAGDYDDNGVSLDADSLLLNGGTIRDSANNDATRTHSAVAANRTHRVDAVRPVFQSAQLTLDELTLTYDEPLDETSVPPTSAFTVLIDSRRRSLINVEVRGRKVLLLLFGTVDPDEDAVTVSYTPGTSPLRDPLGNPAALVSEQPVTNEPPPYDTDADGLIEITTVAQLHAVRYDPNGDGNPSSGAATYRAAFPDDSPPLTCVGGCQGYEVVSDLDFAAAGMWNTGAGWNPIGSFVDPFNTTFEGNGHTIANLHINRSDDAGLFGVSSGSAVIRNVGLVNVNVTGGPGADNHGAALAVSNRGTIRGCYATGRVQAGNAGGLVSDNTGTIEASYAAVQVVSAASEPGGAGGLTGDNYTGTITDSYATGRVQGLTAAG